MIADGTLEEDEFEAGEPFDLGGLLTHLQLRFQQTRTASPVITSLVSSTGGYDTAAILLIGLLLLSLHYLHSSYELKLSDEFWTEFELTPNAINDEEVSVESEEVDDHNHTSNDDVFDRLSTIQEDVNDEEEQDLDELIHGSQLPISSPILDFESSTPIHRPSSMASEGSPLNLTSLSDDMNSSLSAADIGAIDRIELGPFTLDSAKELEVEKRSQDEDRCDEESGKVKVVLRVGKKRDSNEVYVTDATKRKHPAEVSHVDVGRVDGFQVNEGPITHTPTASTTTPSNISLALSSAEETYASEQHKMHKMPMTSFSGFPTSDFEECIDEEKQQILPHKELSLESQNVVFEDRIGPLENISSSSDTIQSPLTPPFRPNCHELTSFMEYDRLSAMEGRVLQEVSSPDNVPSKCLKHVLLSSPSKIPILSPRKEQLSSMLQSTSPKPKAKPLPQISDAVMNYFFCDGSHKGEEFLCEIFGEDLEIRMDMHRLSSLSKDDIDGIMRVFDGKETSQNWSERYLNFDILIGHTRLHLPEGNYEYFQAMISERLNDIFIMLHTTRSKLLSKVIIFARDLIFFGSDMALSSETYVNLIHSLLSLTRESQSSKHIQKLTTKSLCVMAQALTSRSFINYFDVIFEATLKNRKMKGEKYACLFMIKFAILMNRDKLTDEELCEIVDKITPMVSDLGIDAFPKTRAEIVELYLVLLKIHPHPTQLDDYYRGFTTFLKSQVPAPTY